MMRVASLIEESPRFIKLAAEFTTNTADDAADLQEEACTPAPVKTQTEKLLFDPYGLLRATAYNEPLSTIYWFYFGMKCMSQDI